MDMRRWSNQKVGRPDLRFCQKRIEMDEKRKGMVMMVMKA